MNTNTRSCASLTYIDPSRSQSFRTPQKRINEGGDVSRFLASQAYRDIGIFLMQLNRSMCPRKQTNSAPEAPPPTSFPIIAGTSFPSSITRLQRILQKLEGFLELAPPDTGPRRFGNVAFRKWLELVENSTDDLLFDCLPPSYKCSIEIDRLSKDGGTDTETETEESNIKDFVNKEQQEQTSALQSELRAYFTGSWGSKQRLDYGTGHELSFIAFLGCLWKLSVFKSVDSELSSNEEEKLSRQLVLGVIHPYLELVRRVIKTYTLEPAGSHGVWGLDDHFFVPYILGSAQLSAPIHNQEPMSTEGSMPGAPETGDIVKKKVVESWRARNLYFGAIGFINDVKTGPFWEHSPILFDISGVRAGWSKINKGMLKMYNAEVLSKFPVIQHFPFGSFFSWDLDPETVEQKRTIHVAAQPSASTAGLPPIGGATAAPWTQTASRTPSGIVPEIEFNRSTSGYPAGGEISTGEASMAAPWASLSDSWATSGAARPGIPYSRMDPHLTKIQRSAGRSSMSSSSRTDNQARHGERDVDISVTKAPWAK